MNEIERGEQAAALLDHPLMKEAFQTARAEYMKAWAESPARDADAREKIYVMVKTLDRVKAHLETIVANGKLERKMIAEQERKRMFGLI